MTSPSTEFIPFARPSIGAAEEDAVVRVLRSGWLTTAAETAAFEREFAAAADSPHALAVNSATSGLHMALEAVGVSPGDLVAMSPYTFTATAEVVRYLGADPLFVDIDPATLTISPDALRRRAAAAAAQGRTVRAVIAVHIGGLRCDMDAILAIASDCRAAVIEDAAHCIPDEVGGRHLGTEGTIGVYSFYATKPITTGEGGMVVTRDAKLAARMRTMRLHGIDRDVWNRYRSAAPAWDYDVVAAGYKYNMPDLQAAIGRVQLAKARTLLAQRAAVAASYHAGLADLGCLTLPAQCASHSHHLFIVRLKTDTLDIERDAFVGLLSDDGIGTSVHYRPLHTMSYYRSRYALQPDDFPLSWQAYRSAFSLPLYAGLSHQQVERIIGSVRTVCGAHSRTVLR